LQDWRQWLQAKIGGIAATFYQLPCKVDELYCDGLDMYSILYWDHIKTEIEKSIKGGKGG